MRDYRCAECDWRGPRYSDLRAHAIDEHGTRNPEVLVCICDVVDDGGPESGPRQTVTEPDEQCPIHGLEVMPEAWLEFGVG